MLRQSWRQLDPSSKMQANWRDDEHLRYSDSIHFLHQL